MDLIHIQDDNAVPGWKLLAKKWVSTLELHRRNDDGLHWYGERAMVSTLAGAVWRARGYCLQDYFCDKTAYNGWGDLWFRMRGHEYAVEAKVLPVRTLRSEKQHLAEMLTEECRAVKRHGRSEGRSWRVGVVFVVPAPSREPDDDAVGRFIQEARKVGSSSIAWWFPERLRPLRSPNGRFYPGVIMVGRLARQGSQM